MCFRMTCNSLSLLIGFSINSSTRVFGITFSNSCMLISNALNKMILTSGFIFLMLLAISNPVSPGIRISDRTRQYSVECSFQCMKASFGCVKAAAKIPLSKSQRLKIYAIYGSLSITSIFCPYVMCALLKFLPLLHPHFLFIVLLFSFEFCVASYAMGISIQNQVWWRDLAAVCQGTLPSCYWKWYGASDGLHAVCTHSNVYDIWQLLSCS